MSKIVIWIVCAFLVISALAMALLAIAYHRVVVIEGISGTPVADAYISVERSSGPSQEVGRTDENGELAFWVNPLPLPRSICAQKTFYPTGCVNAIGLTKKVIELAVP